MDSFGVLLQKYVSSYKKLLNPKKSLIAFCSADKRVDELQASCKENNINFNPNDIKAFIKALFTLDPKGLSLNNDYVNSFVGYQNNEYPTDLSVIDFLTPSNNVETTYLSVRPKCNKCGKSHYFGLNFCPWCMKKTVKWYPKVLPDYASQSTEPMIAMDALDISSKVTPVESVFSKPKPDECIIDDGYIKVTHADVENVRKTIKKYIPCG